MTRSREPQVPAPEDPQLRRMLATHIHCGEDMQLVSPAGAGRPGRAEGKDDAAPVTYRCSCGFSFDDSPGE